MSKVGRKILEALREFGDVLESGEPLERHFTVRSYAVPTAPAEYDGPAIRAVRDRYAMSQGIFAGFLCVSPATIRSWEQGRRSPSPIARRLLDEMVASPEHFQARFASLAVPKAGHAPGAATNRRGVEAGPAEKSGAKKGRVKAR